MTDWNEQINIALTYKGFFQVYDGATPFRFKKLQEVTIIVSADSEKHYSDDGIKNLDSIGDSSTFTFRTKKTADLFDTADPPTDTKTISYFMDQIMNERVLPISRFEGVQQTEAPSNAFVHVDFTGFVTDIEDTRNATTGAPEVVITGEIRVSTLAQRSAT